MENYGSIKDIVLTEDYNDFIKIKGFGKSKVVSLV